METEYTHALLIEALKFGMSQLMQAGQYFGYWNGIGGADWNVNVRCAWLEIEAEVTLDRSGDQELVELELVRV